MRHLWMSGLGRLAIPFLIGLLSIVSCSSDAMESAFQQIDARLPAGQFACNSGYCFARQRVAIRHGRSPEHAESMAYLKAVSDLQLAVFDLLWSADKDYPYIFYSLFHSAQPMNISGAKVLEKEISGGYLEITVGISVKKIEFPEIDRESARSKWLMEQCVDVAAVDGKVRLGVGQYSIDELCREAKQ